MSTVTRRFWRVRPEVPGEGVEDGQTSAAARARVGGAGAVAALVLPVAALGAAPAQVQVGDFNRSPEIEFNAFYPGTITVAQGSRVKFTALGFHTITFPKKGVVPPSLIVAGPALNPPQTDPTGAPYWWGGTTPQLAFNPAVPGPSGGTAVTGAKMVSSGFLPDKNPTFTRTPGPARTARPGQLPCGA